MSKIYYIRYHSEGEIRTNFILAISPRYAVQTLMEDYKIPKSNIIAVYEHMEEKTWM